MFKKWKEEQARRQEIVESRRTMTDAERYEMRKKAQAEFLAKPSAYDDNRAVSAVLISTQDETKTKKSAGRAIVGGALFGPAGAVVGAATAKEKTKVVGQKAVFSVKYASGRTGTETVEVGSERFEALAKLLVR